MQVAHNKNKILQIHNINMFKKKTNNNNQKKALFIHIYNETN